MSYSSNPLLPKARVWAIKSVLRDGLPVSVAARRAGIHRATLWRWCKRWLELGCAGTTKSLPTLSSRPKQPARLVSRAGCGTHCLLAKIQEPLCGHCARPLLARRYPCFTQYRPAGTAARGINCRQTLPQAVPSTGAATSGRCPWQTRADRYGAPVARPPQAKNVSVHSGRCLLTLGIR